MTEASANEQQKKRLGNAFRLSIPTVDGSAVSKISGFRFTRAVTESEAGKPHAYTASGAISNLVVTVDAARGKDFSTWIAQGGRSKSGVLYYLRSDPTKSFFKLSMQSITLVKLTAEKSATGADNVQRLNAELAVQGLKLERTP